MKSIIQSFSPKECERIARGEQTIKICKTAPKEVPFKVYMYCTAIKDRKHYTDEFDIPIETGMWKGNGHIVGEFVCDKVNKYDFSNYEAKYRVTDIELMNMCINHPELIEIGKGKPLFGLHISDLKIYDKPKELGEFSRYGIKYRGGACLNYNCKYNIYNGYYEPPTCKIDGCVITRPPKGWQYVEELK